MPTIITTIDREPGGATRPPWLHRATAPLFGGIALGLITLANLLLGMLAGRRPEPRPAPVTPRRPRIATEPEDRLFDL